MTTENTVVAIDGPVGSGKTTVARLVARRLGFVLVDTGALYRCLALQAVRRGVDLDDEQGLASLAETSQVRFEESSEGQGVYLDDEDVSDAIREPDISQAASRVSVHPRVREALLETQRGFARRGGAVLEGRDIGTVVFPDAPVKVFVSAPVEVRARRRYDELLAKGIEVDYERTIEEVRQRDERDAKRKTAPLKPATDAVIIDSGDLTAEQVAERVLALVEKVQAERKRT